MNIAWHQIQCCMSYIRYKVSISDITSLTSYVYTSSPKATFFNNSNLCTISCSPACRRNSSWSSSNNKVIKIIVVTTCLSGHAEERWANLQSPLVYLSYRSGSDIGKGSSGKVPRRGCKWRKEKHADRDKREFHSNQLMLWRFDSDTMICFGWTVMRM